MRRRREPRARLAHLPGLLILLSVLAPEARAGFTETLPQGMFLIDEAFIYAWVDRTYDNAGKATALIEPIERYEPGAGLQGTITADPLVQNYVLVNQLQAGVFDWLSLGIGIPVMLTTKIDPRLGWEPGSYQSRLGRAFTEEDFWEWANAMGQPRPEAFNGNKGALGDIIIGTRWRFGHHLREWLEPVGLELALTVTGNLPVGEVADPEKMVALGATNWDLQSQADLAIHLGIEKFFPEALDDRLVIGLDLFYEAFFWREFETPTGEENPLMLNYDEYVGDTYEFKGGDFSGFALQLSGALYQGPEWTTWLTEDNPALAASLPPIISASVKYIFVYLQQSDWRSDSAHWDYAKEKLYKPGYKNYLSAKVTFSFLRLGAPFQLYVTARSMSIIPGKNSRAVDSVAVGLQVPVAF